MQGVHFQPGLAAGGKPRLVFICPMSGHPVLLGHVGSSQEVMLTSRDKNLAILDPGHRTPCLDWSKAKGRPRVGRRHEGDGVSTPPPPVLWNVCTQWGKQVMTLLVPSDAETEIQRG